VAKGLCGSPRCQLGGPTSNPRAGLPTIEAPSDSRPGGARESDPHCAPGARSSGQRHPTDTPRAAARELHDPAAFTKARHPCRPRARKPVYSACSCRFWPDAGNRFGRRPGTWVGASATMTIGGITEDHLCSALARRDMAVAVALRRQRTKPSRSRPSRAAGGRAATSFVSSSWTAPVADNSLLVVVMQPGPSQDW